jgi:putative hydrolase of the HAD superfamily
VIRNVVFDIGNVFVRWSPATIVERVFGDAPSSPENSRRARALFASETWLDLNRGRMTLADAIADVAGRNRLSAAQADALAFHVMDHLDPVPGTEALARRVKSAGYRTFALTDNVHEIVAHLRERHSFWPLFEGVANSAEIGVLKPDPAIYRHLLDTHGLVARECVFMDDIPRNVEGAQSAGMSAFVFETAAQAETALRAHGLEFV